MPHPLAPTSLVLAAMAPLAAAADVDPTRFDPAGLLRVPETVACTLEDGTAATCLRLVTGTLPDGLAVGPFCPSTTAEAGGVWQWTSGDAPGLYRLDDAFWSMAAEQGYDFTDGAGTINIVTLGGDPRSGPPEGAADHSCIAVDQVAGIEITTLIPLTPVPADAPTSLGVVSKVGLSLGGVPIFSDAPPVEATGNLPALDTCGGHVDPGGWYHWHATASDVDTAFDAAEVDASCASLVQDASAQFGYAFDGYPILGSLDADGHMPDDLDACNGHTSAELGYHYHAGTEFPNLPPCLTGTTARDNFVTTAQFGVGAERAEGGGGPRGGPQGGPPDLAEAAAKLGIDEGVLIEAIRTAGGPPPDMDIVAATLGISPETLRDALPPPPQGRRP